MILCKIAKIEDARVPQADEGGDSSQRGLVSVLLGVADSGPGIHPSAQEHVLKAFTTGNAVPREDISSQTKSTGIGLRLADLIAEILLRQPLRWNNGSNYARQQPPGHR